MSPRICTEEAHMRTRLVTLATLFGILSAATAFAGHHSWDFTEAYSIASGTVQFVELFCPSNGEAGLGPFGLTSTTNSLNFVTNLSSSTTANTWVLCATSGFENLPGGVLPDYVIPANFFPTAGGTFNYAGGADVWNYGAVPTDGVLALQRNGSSANNSPTNFAGASGSISLAAAVPAVTLWGIAGLIGAVLLFASGLLRRRIQ
jgi:hypothetical protein